MYRNSIYSFNIDRRALLVSIGGVIVAIVVYMIFGLTRSIILSVKPIIFETTMLITFSGVSLSVNVIYAIVYIILCVLLNKSFRKASTGFNITIALLSSFVFFCSIKDIMLITELITNSHSNVIFENMIRSLSILLYFSAHIALFVEFRKSPLRKNVLLLTIYPITYFVLDIVLIEIVPIFVRFTYNGYTVMYSIATIILSLSMSGSIIFFVKKFVELKEDTTTITRTYDMVTKRFTKQPILEENRKNNDIQYCKNCGVIVSKSARYCLNCGARLND